MKILCTNCTANSYEQKKCTLRCASHVRYDSKQLDCVTVEAVNRTLADKTAAVRVMQLQLTFRHRASCILGQAFHYSPENAFYKFNQQIYFII